MKNLSLLFVLVLFISIQTGCKDDDDMSSEDCTGLLESGGEIEIDGETLSLSIAQLLITSGFEGTSYQFQVGGIASDCNSSRILSFNIEIDENAVLDGTYTITNFFDAGLGDFFGVNIVDQTFVPLSQSATEVRSGTIEVVRNGERDFTMDIQGVLVTGGAISANFSKAF